jgi:hypothetical protein
MADKNFKVKKNIQVTDLAVAGPVTVDSSGVLASSSALPVNLGGTGQTSASAAFDALLPTQTNNANKLLGTNGTSASWVSPGIAYQTSAPDNPVTGQLWVDSDETGDSLDPYIIRRKTITATAGQTVFTTDVIFTDGYEQIYYNGVLLVRTTDYTTNGGTNTVTLLQGASAGDTVEIISSTPINLVNTATLSANTFIGTQAINVSQSSSLGLVINSSTGDPLHLNRYASPSGIIARTTNGSISAPTPVLLNERFAFFIGAGYDGTTYGNNAAINMYAAENLTPTTRGSFITFDTTNIGSAGRSEKMRITSAGNVGIGTSVPAVKLQIDGTFGFRDNSQSVPAQDNGTNPTLIMTNNFSGGSGETSLFNTCAGLTGGIRLSQVTGTGTYKDMAWFQKNLTYQYVPLYSLAPATDISFSSQWVAGTATNSYNYIINGANNTGGNGLVVFLNGSTRAEDNGANSLTIRNDVANMYLGRSGATTFIFGRSDVSDQDLKENIQTYSNATDIIKSLVPKQFNFIGSERKQYGFIAQDIENEEIVLPGGEGVPWSVDYNSIVSALVKANQELIERLEALEATVNE